MRKRNAYYRQVSAWLPCGGKCKREIMERIRANVDAYLAEHPDAGLEEIEAHFGGPREIAAAYVANLDTGELLAALRVRRRIMAAVMAAVLFVVLSWSGCVLWAANEATKSFGGHTEDALIEGEWQEGMDYDDYYK